MSFKNQIGKKHPRECSLRGRYRAQAMVNDTETSDPETCSARSVHPGVAAARPRDSGQVAGASTLHT